MFPNTVTLADKASAYGFGGNAIQSIAMTHQPTQKIPKCLSQFYYLKQYFTNALFFGIFKILIQVCVFFIDFRER